METSNLRLKKLYKKLNQCIPSLKYLDTFVLLGVLFLKGHFPSHIQHVLTKFLLNSRRNNSLLTDIEDDYPCPKNIPYSFPVVRAGIAKCSTYAVISRLKLSPTYTITVSGGTFAHPDYPLVTITVPQNAVGNETRLPLQLKVGCLHS